VNRTSARVSARKPEQLALIDQVIDFAMTISSLMSTRTTQGVVGARQIKIRKSIASLQSSKAPLQAFRPRHAAQRLDILCSYGRDPRFRQRASNFKDRKKASNGINDFRRKTPPSPETIKIVVREYAVPALGVLALATVLGPLIGAVAFSVFFFASAIAATITFFSLSWIFIPVILSFMGLPLLFGGGVATSLFAGAAGVLLFPTLLNIGLITAALYLGVKVARSMWYVGGDDGSEDDNSNGTIDIEAETFDAMEREMEMEAKKREQELREFDELLKRRERFQRGGSGGSSSGGY
jgi:hypothetical protein